MLGPGFGVTVAASVPAVPVPLSLPALPVEPGLVLGEPDGEGVPGFDGVPARPFLPGCRAASRSAASRCSLVRQALAWLFSSVTFSPACVRLSTAIVSLTWLRWYSGRYLSSISGWSSSTSLSFIHARSWLMPR